MQSPYASGPLFAGMDLPGLLEQAQSKYRVRFEPVKVGDASLDVLQIANMEEYLDQMAAGLDAETPLELPFWARIWPTSILLSFFVQRIHAADTAHLLEIGAGIGLCGLFAAKQGIRTTLSDINEDALLFSQINILQNDLQNLADVHRIDFTQDRLSRRYDMILGSEVLYQEASYRPLSKFLKHHLRAHKDSEIILAKSYRLKAKPFFKAAEKEFSIQERVIGYKEQQDQASPENERHLSHIYRLRPRKRENGEHRCS